MKKALIAASCAALLSATAQADVLGIYVGGSVWQQETSGDYGERGNLADFNLADETKANLYAAFEHPVPFVPNVKLAIADLDSQGQTVLTDDFSFQDGFFPAGSTVDGTFDLSYVDYTFYYELLDNGLASLDVGLTARDVDGFANVRSSVNAQTVSASQDFSGFLPMLYSAAEIGLPFTGLSLYAEANMLILDDDSFIDAQAGLAYALIDNIAVDVNLFVGYRQVTVDIEDFDDIYADMEYKGAYAGAEIHF